MTLLSMVTPTPGRICLYGSFLTAGFVTSGLRPKSLPKADGWLGTKSEMIGYRDYKSLWSVRYSAFAAAMPIEGRPNMSSCQIGDIVIVKQYLIRCPFRYACMDHLIMDSPGLHRALSEVSGWKKRSLKLLCVFLSHCHTVTVEREFRDFLRFKINVFSGTGTRHQIQSSGLGRCATRRVEVKTME